MKKILFLCKGNSARSQMAEAILNKAKDERYTAVSAGSEPNDRANPLALEVLSDNGFDVSGLKPKSMLDFIDEQVDFVITLCDDMKEDCPVYPSKPVYAHWGMPDPATFEGTEEERKAFFHKTFREINNRVHLFLCLDMSHMDRERIEDELGNIGNTWKYVR